MKIFINLFLCVTSLLFFIACASSDSPDLVDNKVTKETAALYSNLLSLAEKGTMFGHHEAMAYGVGWWGEEGRSDVKEICGAYPAIHGWDIGKIGTPNSINGVPFVDVKNYIRKVYERGGINTVAWHMDNYLSGGDSWDTTNAVKELLPGGKAHGLYLEKLDLAAEFFNSLKAGDISIPVIFRPFHEHNGDWFWWGKGIATEEEYKQLWRFTVDYLRDEKGVHNLLYAFSPDRSRLNLQNPEEEYLYGYPGDEYVDIIGLDNYWDVGHPANETPLAEQRGDFAKSMELISRIAADKGKIAALTETGMEKIPFTKWYTEHVLKTLKESPEPLNISYIMVWRNANPGHHYAPYPGHPAAQDFQQFCQDSLILLEDDIQNVYTRGEPLLSSEK